MKHPRLQRLLQTYGRRLDPGPRDAPTSSHRNERIVTAGFVAVAGSVVLFVGLIAASGLYRLHLSQTGQEKREAERQALEWAGKLYPGERAAADCQDLDTDGNGYVSCSLRVGEQVLPLECAGVCAGRAGCGCRVPRVLLQTTE